MRTCAGGLAAFTRATFHVFEPRGQTRLLHDTNREEINVLPAQTKTGVCVCITKADGRRSEGQMEDCFLAVYPLQ